MCPKGSYGPQCQLNCSDRNCLYKDSTCIPSTGRCDGGCQAGWNGIDCIKRTGTYAFRICLYTHELYSKSSAIIAVYII